MIDSYYTVIAIQAALHSGHLLRRAFNTSFAIDSKPGMHNLVTEWDRASEQSIIATILRHFPKHSILAEESGQHMQHASDVTWVIDPLDGTVNFAHGIPLFSVSIAVVVHKVVHSAVVYSPILDELFVAEKGRGAFLNGTPLCVSTVGQLQDSFLSTGFPYNVDKNPLHCIETFSHILGKGIPIRRLGSAALDLSYVAAGRFDAFWELNLSPWDSAAGILLVEEAGGKVTQYDGSPYHLFTDKTLVTSNGFLHNELIHSLRNV
jgi:myo-inositol-1(or 4)-monophosphatase